ncbi:MAG: DUF4129 domain-containing transglutaminase family protein [Anaerolineales bacterium]
MNSDKTRPAFDWLTLFLLITLILVAAWTITVTDWADFLGLIPLVGFIGVIAGTALARSNFRPVIAGFFALIYGLFIVAWQLGTTMDQALVWRSRIFSLLGRSWIYLRVIVNGEVNDDPLMFVVMMALLFWFLGSYGAWRVFRRSSAWTVILISGVTIFLVIYFYLGSTKIDLFLAGFIFLALILAVRVDMAQRQTKWTNIRARVPTDISYRLSRSALVITLLLIAFAWAVPAFARSDNLAEAWKNVTDPLTAFRERAGDALGSLRGPVAVMATEYGDELLLEAGIQPINRLVMHVDPGKLPSLNGRFYWRSRVYETYQDSQWLAGESDTHRFQPDDGELILQDTLGRESIAVTFAPKSAAIQLLYMPSQPTWVDRSSTIQTVVQEGEVVDVLRFTSRRYIHEGETYETVASVAVPSGNELRDAGESYPQWVLDRYLQVPAEITDRTLELAVTITEGLETPYDKAIAVTSWLRQNIEYSRVTDSPPEDVEPIDWFLFDYQIGYCNFYASSEVIMLRSLGIPARLAAGYARGVYTPSNGLFQVEGEDSHSWPEVFFPGYGWVEFEPTVSQAVLTRPEDRLNDSSADSFTGTSTGLDGEIPDETRFEDLLEPDDVGPGAPVSIWQLLPIVQIVFFSILVVLGIVIWLRYNPSSWIATRRIILSGFSTIGMDPPESLKMGDMGWKTFTGRIYASWSVWLNRLDLAGDPTETAMERVRKFEDALPDAAEDAHIIVDAYSRERFGGQKVDEGEVKKSWRKMRGALWLAWIWRLTSRWRSSS